MSKAKRLLSFVLCLTLALTLISVTAFAEGSKTNMTVTASPTSVQQGDTVTVTIKNGAMKVSSFTGGIEYDTEYLECTSIEEGDTEVDVISTVDEAESAGTVGFAIIGFKDTNFDAGTLSTVKFKAKKIGTAEITLYEDSAGADGYKSDNAQKVKVEITEKHTLSKVAAKAATCTEAGYKEYWKCSDCGKLFSDSEGKKEIKEPEAVAALGHSLTKTATKAATCTADGNIEYYTCSRCNKLFSDKDGKTEITKDKTVVKATGHNWGEWQVTKAATELEKGTETRTCKNDSSHKETRDIPATGIHSLTKVSAKAATCVADGNIEYYKCSGCGKLFADKDGKTEITVDKTVVKATGHNWGEWQVTKAATELQAGSESRTCKNDPAHKETRSIPATGIHTMTTISAKAATCTTDGNIEYYKCSGCGKLFADKDGKKEIDEEDTVVKATGHDWGEWVVTKAATKTEKGSETRTCKTDPSHKETRDIPALDHVHSTKAVAAKLATCTEDGNIAYWVCTTCGKKFADEKATKELQNEDVVVKAIGHDWGEWKVITEPTATKYGKEKRVCKNDPTHVKIRTIPATGEEDNSVTVKVKTSEGGKVEPAEATVVKGDSHDFTATPDKGYEIADVKVNGKSIGTSDKFTVTDIDSDTTIEVTFKKKSADPDVKPQPDPDTGKYTDVAKGTWYYDAVYYATEKGYVNGVGNNLYAPEYPVTRATIAQIVYAMEGKPAGAKSAGFKDVPGGKWFTDAVNWCAAQGIVAGYNSESFGPEDPITRQQLATILYQYAKYKGYDTAANGDLRKFEDSSSVSTYAVTPLKWAVGHKLISGTDIGLEPKGTATRAQIAVILQAFDKNVKK